MESKIILGRILQKLIDQGYTKYQDYYSFGFVKLNDTSIIVSRETGEDTRIPFDELMIGINGYKENNELYDEGPGAIRTLGISHISSPIHSLLHLLPKDAYA